MSATCLPLKVRGCWAPGTPDFEIVTLPSPKLDDELKTDEGCKRLSEAELAKGLPWLIGVLTPLRLVEKSQGKATEGIDVHLQAAGSKTSPPGSSFSG